MFVYTSRQIHLAAGVWIVSRAQINIDYSPTEHLLQSKV